MAMCYAVRRTLFESPGSAARPVRRKETSTSIGMGDPTDLKRSRIIPPSIEQRSARRKLLGRQNRNPPRSKADDVSGLAGGSREHAGHLHLTRNRIASAFGNFAHHNGIERTSNERVRNGGQRKRTRSGAKSPVKSLPINQGDAAVAAGKFFGVERVASRGCKATDACCNDNPTRKVLRRLQLDHGVRDARPGVEYVAKCRPAGECVVDDAAEGDTISIDFVRIRAHRGYHAIHIIRGAACPNDQRAGKQQGGKYG